MREQWEGEGTPPAARSATTPLTPTLSPAGERGEFFRAPLPSARTLAGADAARVPAAPHRPGPRPARSSPRLFIALGLVLLLAACATQAGNAVAPQAPGFLLGVWHGFIFPVAWILSLFMPEVSVYAVPNNGGWYDFGYFIGIVFLGVGARGARRRG